VTEPVGERAVARVRRAVRAALAAVPVGASVPLLVPASGGPDSTALAAAAVAVAGGRPVHAAVVDHGLQDGSARIAAEAAERLAALGLAARVHRVEVGVAGGPEAAARRARYAALRAVRPHPDSPVLLGHTRDDQAETVLLGLGRGSGARSLAGMRGWDPPWLRPLLDVPRATTRAACAAQGLPVWDDPHNLDPRFTRVRLRTQVLPLLEDVLNGGVAAALARTAEQLREDADALDALAGAALRDLTADTPGADTLPVAPLADLHPAVRRRVLRAWLAARGVTGLTATHLAAADVLAGRGPDRAGVAVPGGLELVRRHGTLSLQTVGWSADRPTSHPREDSRRVRR
jgi:tRNA(Ile)-lysidine synthase